MFRELHDQLRARYPCICTLSDDRVDEEGVWSDGPLLNDFGRRAAVLGVIYSRVEEVLPFLVHTANDLGLNTWTALARVGNSPPLSRFEQGPDRGVDAALA